jgi:hypothetical protein
LRHKKRGAGQIFRYATNLPLLAALTVLMSQGLPKSTQFFVSIAPVIVFIFGIHLTVNGFIFLGKALLISTFIYCLIRMFFARKEIWKFINLRRVNEVEAPYSFLKKIFNIVSLLAFIFLLIVALLIFFYFLGAFY